MPRRKRNAGSSSDGTEDSDFSTDLEHTDSSESDGTSRRSARVTRSSARLSQSSQDSSPVRNLQSFGTEEPAYSTRRVTCSQQQPTPVTPKKYPLRQTRSSGSETEQVSPPRTPTGNAPSSESDIDISSPNVSHDENIAKDMSLKDSGSDLSHRPKRRRFHESYNFNMKCPTPGCNSLWHLTGKHERHFSISGCPLYHNLSADECKHQAPSERQLRYKEKVAELRKKRNSGLSKEISIKEINQETAVNPVDIVSTLQALQMLKYWKGKHLVLKRQDLIDEWIAKEAKKSNSNKTMDPSCLKWTLPRALKVTCHSEPANPSSRNPYPRDLSVISVALVIGKYSILWEGHPPQDCPGSDLHLHCRRWF
uniref:Histone acetyltransferase n=1 Tax=Marmota marmota marmota TaxID=9994 RepID=A0A8C6ER21_MARMA